MVIRKNIIRASGDTKREREKIKQCLRRSVKVLKTLDWMEEPIRNKSRISDTMMPKREPLKNNHLYFGFF